MGAGEQRGHHDRDAEVERRRRDGQRVREDLGDHRAPAPPVEGGRERPPSAHERHRGGQADHPDGYGDADEREEVRVGEHQEPYEQDGADLAQRVERSHPAQPEFDLEQDRVIVLGDL